MRQELSLGRGHLVAHAFQQVVEAEGPGDELDVGLREVHVAEHEDFEELDLILGAE